MRIVRSLMGARFPVLVRARFRSIAKGVGSDSLGKPRWGW
jgi:hypothetical protein